MFVAGVLDLHNVTDLSSKPWRRLKISWLTAIGLLPIQLLSLIGVFMGGFLSAVWSFVSRSTSINLFD